MESQTSVSVKRQRKTAAAGKRTSLNEKYGTSFPVTRLRRKLKLLTKRRVGEQTGAFLAKVLDIIVSEALRNGVTMAHSQKLKRLSPRTLYVPMNLDGDLLKVAREAIWAFSGTQQHVHKVLFKPYKGRFVENPRRGRRRRGARSTSVAKKPRASRASKKSVTAAAATKKSSVASKKSATPRKSSAAASKKSNATGAKKASVASAAASKKSGKAASVKSKASGAARKSVKSSGSKKSSVIETTPSEKVADPAAEQPLVD